MAFQDSFVDEVRRTANIVTYISESVPLKKMGASWKGLCPFHNEKTPSFNVRSEPPVFHCFGCGVGGDVFKFVMLRERVNFPEAIEVIARRFGIPVPETRGYEPGPDRKEREEVLALLEVAAQHFTRNLWTAPGTAAREYLLGRGFEKATLEKIRAGAAPDSWSDLLDALRRKFPPTVLATAGLVLERQDRSGYYDRFRNRAVFPILNESGKVVAFGARALDGSEPKYLNSPETPVYQKSRTLYGLSWARDAIREQGRVVMMEGYLDVARAIEKGVQEVVATCGTALTAGHARLLHRFGDKVVVNFDQDEAGRKATLKSLEILTEEGLAVQVVSLPPGDDPDSFLKSAGAEPYRERLAKAPVYVEWLIERAAAENDTRTPPGKAAYLKALLPTLVKIESAVERAAWLPRVVAKGQLDGAAAEQELRRALSVQGGGRAGAVAGASPPRPPARQGQRLTPVEKLFVAHLVKETPDGAAAVGTLEPPDFEPLRIASILAAAKLLSLKGHSLSAAALEEALVEEEDRRLVREIAIASPPLGSTTPEGCATELRRLSVDRQLKALRTDISEKTARGEDCTQLFLENDRLARVAKELRSL